MTILPLIIAAVLSLPWPFSSGGHAIQRGYGDYNSGSLRIQYDGFHPAVDVLPPEPGSIITLPFSGSNYVAQAVFFPPETWSVLITETFPPSGNGYLYHHVHGSANEFSQGDCLTEYQRCATPPFGGYAHVHISIFDPSTWPSSGQIPEPGLANIIQYLEGYTDIVKYKGYAYNNRGIGFYPADGLMGVPDSFQDVIRGAVDFVVMPRSVNPNFPSHDSCGVTRIEIGSISRHNPFSEEYSAVSFYEQRTVFSWAEELVDCSANPAPEEYFFLYRGKGESSSTSVPFGSQNFNMFYHVSNSSVVDPGVTGIDNIYTENYDSQSDEADGVRCRGAWDTVLKINWDSQDQSACENSEACFPDGRYLVDISTTSQTGFESSISLPVVDVSTNPIPLGILVDNFIPHIESVLVYTTYPYPGTYTSLYSGTWNSNGFERSLDSTEYSYLPRELGISRYSGVLGVAIKFSEPINRTMPPPSVWLEGYWGGETRWYSYDEPELVFEYIADPTGNPFIESSEYGEWVCYETRYYSDPGYVGELSVVIDGAEDLNGNPLDIDPQSIEPVLLPESSTPFVLHNLSSQDRNHKWAQLAPHYRRTSVRNLVGNLRPFGYEFGVEIPHSLQSYFFEGDCSWWSGAWFSFTEDGASSVDVQILGPDASQRTEVVSTPYPVIVYDGLNWNSYQIETGSYCFFADSLAGSRFALNTDDFFWFTVENQMTYAVGPGVEPCGISSTTIYCVSREMETVLSYQLCAGESWETQVGEVDYTHITELSPSTIPNQIIVEYQIIEPPGTPSDVVSVTITVDPLDNTMVSSLSCPSNSDDALLSHSPSLSLMINLSANPVVGSAAVNFSTPVTGHAMVQVFDLAGRSVQTLVNGEVAAGNHSVNWSTENISSGVYFVRLTTTDGTVSTQAIVLR